MQSSIFGSPQPTWSKSAAAAWRANSCIPFESMYPDHQKLGPYVGKFESETGYSLRFEVSGRVGTGAIGSADNAGEINYEDLGNADT
jgi:hypothetical protein